jgi:hypothetical protein
VEDALERAARDAGTVFLTPGALVDLRPVAVIPLMSDLVRSAHTRLESVIELASIQAAPVQPMAEVHNEAAEVCAATPIEGSNAPEPFVAASDTLIVADLAAKPALREPDTANNFVPEFAVEPEIPVLSETLPTLAALAAAKLEEQIPAVEIQPELSLQEADLLPAEEAAVVPAVVASLPLPAVIPAEAPEKAPVLQSVALEPEAPTEPEEQVKIPILVPPVAARAERKIRIVLPGLRKNVRVWAAAALLFAITTLTVLFISTKPASQAEKVRAPAPQTSSQTPKALTQNVPATATQAPRVNRPASVPSHRTVHTSDDGYIAKDTVVRYGRNGPAPGKKPASQSGATLNRSSRD